MDVAIHKSAVSGRVLKIPDSEPADLRLNHYFSKSEAAFARKIRRGYDWCAEGERRKSLRDSMPFQMEGERYSMSRFAHPLKMRLAVAGRKPPLGNLEMRSINYLRVGSPLRRATTVEESFPFLMDHLFDLEIGS